MYADTDSINAWPHKDEDFMRYMTGRRYNKIAWKDMLTLYGVRCSGKIYTERMRENDKINKSGSVDKADQ